MKQSPRPPPHHKQTHADLPRPPPTPPPPPHDRENKSQKLIPRPPIPPQLHDREKLLQRLASNAEIALKTRCVRHSQHRKYKSGRRQPLSDTVRTDCGRGKNRLIFSKLSPERLHLISMISMRILNGRRISIGAYQLIVQYSREGYGSGDLLLWCPSEDENSMLGLNLLSKEKLTYECDYFNQNTNHTFTISYGDRKLEYRHDKKGRITFLLTCGSKTHVVALPHGKTLPYGVVKCDCDDSSDHWKKCRTLLNDIVVASHQFKPEVNNTIVDIEKWYAFADDAGIASEYLPLVVFLPLDKQSLHVSLNDLCEFSCSGSNRLKPGIDFV